MSYDVVDDIEPQVGGAGLHEETLGVQGVIRADPEPSRAFFLRRQVAGRAGFRIFRGPF